MTVAWLQLFVAGLLEVAWAIGLKLSGGFDFRGRPFASTATLATMIASMWLLSVAARTLPIGTAYAVWTGIGALGAAVLGILMFHEPASPVRIVCLLMLVVGIVGLKLSSPAAAASPAAPASQPSNDMTAPLYVGTYTNGSSKGIYRIPFDGATGVLGQPTLAVETPNASYLEFTLDGRRLYAVAEIESYDGKKSGAIAGFAVQPDGTLREINRQPSGGPGPCYVGLTPDAHAAFAANYSGGSVAMLTIGPDGALAPPSTVDQHVGGSLNPKRQDKAYAHSLRSDPAGKFAIGCDLGTDEVITYRIEGDTMSRASVAKVVPGSGPRHTAFSVDGKSLYVVNEMALTISRFDYDPATGALTFRQTVSTLPADHAPTDADTAAEIHVHPNGRFVYASNRGHDSIATLAIHAETGALSLVGTTPSAGHSPRNFVIDPSGRWLITSNQKPGNLASLAIDPTTGLLDPTGSTLELSGACCARFLPASGGR